MKYLLSIWVILFISLSQSTTWYYIHNFSDQSSLYSTGCYRGTYGPISLLTCPHPNATFLEDLPDALPLCVVQTSNSSLSFLKPDTIVHQLDDYYVVIPLSPSVCEDDIQKPFAVKVFENPLVPLPTDKEFIMVSAPDPLIQELLTRVTGANMMASIRELAAFYTRHSRAYGSVQAQEYLVSRFNNYGLKTSTFNFATNTSSCVIAEITGTSKPNEIIVVGAHYDSRAAGNVATERAPGANDDASGVSVLLELARIISTFGLKFERTVRLTAFSGEEQGLLGSRAYARNLQSNNVNVYAMFNGDMLGWKPANSPQSLGMKRDYVDNNLLASANTITNTYVPELGIGVSTSCCSDYVSFHEVGYSAIGYFQFPGTAAQYPYYHTVNDIPTHMDAAFLGLEGKAMIAAVLTYGAVFRNE